jgi:hypothetical protein
MRVAVLLLWRMLNFLDNILGGGSLVLVGSRQLSSAI